MLVNWIVVCGKLLEDMVWFPSELQPLFLDFLWRNKFLMQVYYTDLDDSDSMAPLGSNEYLKLEPRADIEVSHCE